MNLFIDIDGVLLGKAPHSPQPQLANEAEVFLKFCLKHFDFDCYWLTTHCKGDASTALDYLAPYMQPSVATLAAKIQPSTFKTFKTEALFGDFICIDDQPTAYELQVLEEKDWLVRWFEVNTRKNLNALIGLVPLLEQRLSKQI